MTLRQLVWAADGRQRGEWVRIASLACSIHTSLTQQLSGGRFDPQAMIPDRYREKPPPAQPKSPEQIEAENQAAWTLLGQAFTTRS